MLFSGIRDFVDRIGKTVNGEFDGAGRDAIEMSIIPGRAWVSALASYLAADTAYSNWFEKPQPGAGGGSGGGSRGAGEPDVRSVARDTSTSFNGNAPGFAQRGEEAPGGPTAPVERETPQEEPESLSAQTGASGDLADRAVWTWNRHQGGVPGFGLGPPVRLVSLT